MQLCAGEVVITRSRLSSVVCLLQRSLAPRLASFTLRPVVDMRCAANGQVGRSVRRPTSQASDCYRASDSYRRAAAQAPIVSHMPYYTAHDQAGIGSRPAAAGGGERRGLSWAGGCGEPVIAWRLLQLCGRRLSRAVRPYRRRRRGWPVGGGPGRARAL